MGPKRILARDFNIVFRTINEVFSKYNEKGIVCTKADIVAFGMGGLVVQKFLDDDRKDSDDGNNWTVRSYKQGMVRRIISIATPYLGTPWADILLGTADVPQLTVHD